MSYLYHAHQFAIQAAAQAIFVSKYRVMMSMQLIYKGICFFKF